MVTEQSFPSPGDRVLVPWGLTEELGEVVEVYLTGLGERAVVRMLNFPDPENTVTVPADTLIRAEGPTTDFAPRIETAAFERHALSELKHVAREAGATIREESHLDRGVDAFLDDGLHQVIVQVKYFPSGRVSSDTISTLGGYTHHRRPVILVTNADLTKAALDNLRRLNKLNRLAWFVRWTGPDDKEALRRAVRGAFKASGRQSRL